MNIPDEALFDNLEQVWVKFGRQPFYGEVRKPLSKFAVDVYCRRFGSWIKACGAFIQHKGSDPQFFKTVVPARSSARSRNISEKDRLKIFQRDHHVCVVCGKSPATHRGITLHVDHIKPFSKGGNNSLANLRTLCNKCNLGKGAEEGL